MRKTVNVVIDVSGSMAEDGKDTVVKYLLNGISGSQRTVFADDELHFYFYTWGKCAESIPSEMAAKISFGGKADVSGLEKLKELMDASIPLIFISDGNFEKKCIEKIKSMSYNILPIFIGTDENISRLEEISSNKMVYSVVDFVQAICDA